MFTAHEAHEGGASGSKPSDCVTMCSDSWTSRSKFWQKCLGCCQRTPLQVNSGSNKSSKNTLHIPEACHDGQTSPLASCNERMHRCFIKFSGDVAMWTSNAGPSSFFPQPPAPIVASDLVVYRFAEVKTTTTMIRSGSKR